MYRYIYIYFFLQDGAPKTAKVGLEAAQQWFMVDITIVNGDYNGL